ncbi:MAG: helix-turn-helix domain-containing protein [Clostridia bacterium]|nr:helix-turn-helix domain-containing protein [Clostridia bacterium]
MLYSAELDFLRRILHNYHIDTNILTENEPIPPEIDKGLRAFLNLSHNYEKFFELSGIMKPNTIYKVTDGFMCHYIFLLLPGEESRVLVSGPYIHTEMTKEILFEKAEELKVPAQLVSQMIKYFGNIPLVRNESFLMNIFFSFGEIIWGSENEFSIESISDVEVAKAEIDALRNFKERSEDSLLSIKLLEERYNAERELMQAISQGSYHKVEKLFMNSSGFAFEKRTDDPVRNMKNYLIISNTLFRKAAEYGSVHPFYIDGISSNFAQRIERVKTVPEANELIDEMLRKYCKLVKKHSMKDYSLLIQKVITIIDADLTADLGLKRLAEILNVNASYLSALFKKETDKTLTEYVTVKRVDHAAYLLRSTNLQIQTVAQHCGIFDVNYFAKIFRKYTGKSPKEYREEL